ncbi:uncharacterized protein LOC122817854 [Drosophila biarmipes]|uniref:uncharacterized protein LOC122817854 n=1 Tax=Drosophila biarmipes TaxID=125945 RepID=UPI001CDADF4A|nr:uncharacterized protein LOC122817854 [Drosophila biarmipes]
MIQYIDDILIGSQTFVEMYEKLERILEVTNVTDVRKFLGLTGYFRKFVPSYAIISVPLRVLLHKYHPFTWKTPQEAFDELKKFLISNPVATSYRLDEEHELHMYASAVGFRSFL